MKPRTGARLGAVVLLSTLAVVAAPAAHGTQQERITVRKGQPVVRDYGPLPQNDPFFAESITPSFCSSAPGCDTIPLTILVPTGLRSNEDFFVRITLSWDASTRSNLQLYVWNDPPPNDPQGQRLIAQSSTEQEPENVVLYRPGEGKYFIVVHHVAGSTSSGPSGLNTGYRLRLEMTFQSFESPFELLAPGPPPASSGGGAAVAQSGATRRPPSVGTPMPLALAPLTLDPDFTDLEGGVDARGFAGSPGPLVAQSAWRPPPGPVNGWLLALWAGIVPAAVVAGGALWLRRRAAASLDVS